MQAMAISGFAGRFCRRPSSAPPREVPIVCRFLDYRCGTSSGRWAELHGGTHFSAEAEKSAPRLLLLHKNPAAHHYPPAPPYRHARCCASIKITKICGNQGHRQSQPRYLTPITAAWVSSSGQKGSRNLTLHMNTAQQSLFGQNVISQCTATKRQTPTLCLLAICSNVSQALQFAFISS